jgi:regulator of protease activity HflC (stomatin/prohibitin superfamily)
MSRNLFAILIAVLAVLILVMNTVFIVLQDRQAIVMRYGEYNRTIN